MPFFNQDSHRHHGGLLNRAAAEFAIDYEQWVDLSTGINPYGWRVGPIPDAVWARLPEDNDGLEQVAAEYYRTAQIMPVSGSQAVIQSLPYLRGKSRVLLMTPSYAEHAYAWRTQGHLVKECKDWRVNQIESRLSDTDVLVIVNPNNPSAVRFDVDTLIRWQRTLSKNDGWLVVDEAYIDACPQHSVLSHNPQQGLIVMRSLGKFFGLAGLRLGFVAADRRLLTMMADYLGPWAVNGPARWIAKQALSDVVWQQQTRQRLQEMSLRLSVLLSQYGFKPSAGCELFQWIKHHDAERLYRYFGERGILVRLFQQPLSLRFGLPGKESEWRKLEQVLRELSDQGQAEIAIAAREVGNKPIGKRNRQAQQ